MTSGTLGFGSDAVPITASADTGSDMTFISKILDKLQDPNIRPAKGISVHPTNGAVTQSSHTIRAGLVLGDFKTFSEFRMLEWDAYDVILGINWLRHYRGMWDLAGSPLSLENGSKRHCHLQMRPHRTPDPSSAISEIGINAPAIRRLRKRFEIVPNLRSYIFSEVKKRSKVIRIFRKLSTFITSRS